MQAVTTNAQHPPRRWYRERWPWLLAAGPAIAIAASLASAWVAWATDDGVVADDYYKRGLVINKDLERASRAESLGLGAVVTVGPDGRVKVALTRGDGVAAPPTILATFVNATRAGLDRSAVLSRGADGAYTGGIDPPPRGRWLVGVETDAWRLPSAETGAVIGTVRLGAAGAVD